MTFAATALVGESFVGEGANAAHEPAPDLVARTAPEVMGIR